MKVLAFTSEYAPFRGGIATYAMNVAVAAAELGADVTLCAPDYGQPLGAETRFEVVRYPGASHSPRDIPAKIGIARREAARRRPDVVHAMDWGFVIPTLLLSRGLAPRRIMTLHGTDVNQMARPMQRTILSVLGFPGRFDLFAANSRFTRDLFTSRFPGTKGSSRVALLGASPFWAGEPAPRAYLRQRFGLAPSDIGIVTVGRLTRRKGHLALLSALERLPEGIRCRVRWSVVGPGSEADYEAELRDAAARASVRVEFLGEITDDELRSRYGSADLFCLTGHQDSERIEGFGLVFIEAGAAGVPSLATDVGGVGDAVLDGKTGVLVRPGDEPALVAALERLLSDDVYRAGLGAAARDYAAYLTFRRCAAATYDLDGADS